jgi:hypothetical protein
MHLHAISNRPFSQMHLASHLVQEGRPFLWHFRARGTSFMALCAKSTSIMEFCAKGTSIMAFICGTIGTSAIFMITK